MSALDNLNYTIKGSDPLINWSAGWGPYNDTDGTFAYTRLGRHHMLSGNIRYTGATTSHNGGDILVASYSGLPGLVAPNNGEGCAALSLPTRNTAKWSITPAKALWMRAGGAWTLTQNEFWIFQINWVG